MFDIARTTSRIAIAAILASGLAALPALAQTSETSTRAAGVAAQVADFSTDAASAKGDRETFLIPEDRLAVTLGTPGGAAANDENSYAIWVGEVERDGRKAVWVELIDDYGEVIYDSEVAHNETHLLPDGRAVVVRALADPDSVATTVAKADQSRVAPDARLVVTRRVVNDPELQTEIQFIEEKPREEQSTMMRIATFGHTVWSRIVASLNFAADSVVVAWNWITEPFRA
ncbi:hypothetical protein [Stappia sp. ICDLI1TA098]